MRDGEIVQGKIEKWIAQRGYGFMRPDETQLNIFVHEGKLRDAGFPDSYDPVGQRIEIKIKLSPKGLAAGSVKLLAQLPIATP